MNKKIYASLTIFTSILTCYSLCSEQKSGVGVQLIGVYNMLTKASNAPSRYPARVLLKTDKTPIIGNPWAMKTIRLPMEVELLFENRNLDDNGHAQPYVIRIEEDRSNTYTCPTDKICVKAEVYVKTPGDLAALHTDAIEKTCVTSSTYGWKQGDLISQFQNIMLFLADQDSTDTHTLPFKFGIAAWTATADIWANKFISYSPECSLTGSPKIQFPLKETRYNNTIQNLGLFALQGQPAWGGGRIPRAYHMHIVHIFNNTQYPFLIRRTVPGTLAKYNFEYTIPARSAVPFIYVWLPKIYQQNLNFRPSLASESIQFYVLKKAKKGSLPAGFNPISSIAGETTEEPFNDEDIDAKIDQILENMSESADIISGYNDRIAELQRDKQTEVWTKGRYIYKICAIPHEDIPEEHQQSIAILRWDLKTGTERELSRLTDPRYAGIRPKTDLRLIINEKEVKDPETEDLVELRLDNYIDNKVFQGYLEH